MSNRSGTMRLTLSIIAAPVGRALTSRDIDRTCSIGRDGKVSDWVLPDPTPDVSGRHCVVAPAGDGWTVTDNNSRNGTYLNNEPIGPGETRELRDGDELRICDYVIEVRHRPNAEAAPDPAWRRGAAPWTKSAPGTDLTEPVIKPPPQPPVADQPLPDDPFFAPAPLPGVVVTSGPQWTPPLSPPPVIDPARERHTEPTESGAGDSGLDDTIATGAETPVQPAPGIRLADDAAALAAFLRGAGLSDVTVADPAAAMEALGAAFRAFVSGLRSALETRSSIRRAFHVDETRLQASGNNPLKKQASDDAALRRLLGVDGAPDMTMAAALAGSLRDIELHEKALIEAMPEAAQSLMETLAPAQTHANGDANRLGITVPVLQKARAFDAYHALHARTVRTLDDNFVDSVFGRAFARAYERILQDTKLQEGREPQR